MEKKTAKKEKKIIVPCKRHKFCAFAEIDTSNCTIGDKPEIKGGKFVCFKEKKKAPARKKENPEEITRRDEMREVSRNLSPKEVTESVDVLLKKLNEVDVLETDLKRFRDEIVGQVKLLMKEIQQLRKDIEERKMTSQVECEIVFHWTKGKKDIIRKDTGEKVETIEITDVDTQEKLNLECHGQEVTQPKKKIEEEKSAAPGKKGNEIIVPFEIINDSNYTVEVKNEDHFVEIPFAGLVTGHLFRLIKDGKAIEIDGHNLFVAYEEPILKDGIFTIMAHWKSIAQ